MAERETSEDEVDYFFFGFLRLRVQRLLALLDLLGEKGFLDLDLVGKKE